MVELDFGIRLALGLGGTYLHVCGLDYLDGCWKGLEE
jgi:hypothetical protein